MKQATALKVILVLGLAGLAFSGYLSYNELAGTCSFGCPVVPVNKVFGLPACVIGFFMYLLIVASAALGLAGKRFDRQ